MDARQDAQNAGAYEQGQQKFQELLSRSAIDREFRAQLLENPRQALSSFLGEQVPESLNITFVENRADATIVLPDAIDPEKELAEEELEAVAGGIAWMSVFATVMGTMAVTRGVKTLGDDGAWLS